MKTTLISLLTATLMGFAIQATGRAIGVAELTSIFFAAGLMAWTINQYGRQPAALIATRPIRLPLKLSVKHLAHQEHRLAA